MIHTRAVSTTLHISRENIEKVDVVGQDEQGVSVKESILKMIVEVLTLLILFELTIVIR